MKPLILLVGVVLALSACGKKEESVLPKISTGEVQKEAKQVVSTLAEQTKQERDEFVSKAQKDMDEFNARMAAPRKRHRRRPESRSPSSNSRSRNSSKNRNQLKGNSPN